MYTVAIKSGTNGHFDYDDCDLIVAEIPSDNIPKVGDILSINDKSKRTSYLVREVDYSINLETEEHGFGEWIYVYVVCI